MSSSESEDEQLERFKAAVAPDFSFVKGAPKEESPLLPVSKCVPGSLAVSEPNNAGVARGGPVAEAKPSLRPDKQKQSNSFDALDLDGFTPQFKRHLSKKLGSKLDEELRIGGDGDDDDDDFGVDGDFDDSEDRKEKRAGANRTEGHRSDREDEEEETESAISIFSSSQKSAPTAIQPKRIKKKRKKTLGEDLKLVHLRKKIKAVENLNDPMSSVGDFHPTGHNEVNKGKTDGISVPPEAQIGRNGGDSSENARGEDEDEDDDESEERRRLCSVAVSGDFVLNSSLVILDDNAAPAADSTLENKRKNKKKKKKNKDRDKDGVGCRGKDNEPKTKEEAVGNGNDDTIVGSGNDETVAVDESTDVSKKNNNKRKKKGKRERLKARLRLEEEDRNSGEEVKPSKTMD